MAGICRAVRAFLGMRVVAVFVLLAASMALGQAASSAGSQTVTDVLHQMSDRAGVIFMGQVLRVRLPDGALPASGIVEVDFRVDQAIRGCKAGEPYVLREWGGLWVGSSQRYRVGERLLMLLHAPSAGGISSPVDGLDGAIPIRQSATGTPVAKTETRQPALPFVDLRWLGAKVPRTVSYRSQAAPAAGTSLQPGLAVQQVVMAGAGTGDVPMILPLGYTRASDASTPAQQASVEAVLGLLTKWQKAQYVAP